MKKHDIEPNDTNLVEQFCNDSIERNTDILQFVSLLNSIDDSCSISIDALWEAGKTFFVKQVKMVIDSFNKYVVSAPENIERQVKDAWNQIRV